MIELAVSHASSDASPDAFVDRWVGRRPHPHDRRARVRSVTPAGRDLANRAVRVAGTVGP